MATFFPRLCLRNRKASPGECAGKPSGRQANGPEQVNTMRYLKYAALFGLLACGFAGGAKAQVRVAVGVGPVYGAYGPAPICDRVSLIPEQRQQPARR